MNRLTRNTPDHFQDSRSKWYILTVSNYERRRRKNFFLKKEFYQIHVFSKSDLEKPGISDLVNSRCFPGFWDDFQNSRCFPGLEDMVVKFQVFPGFSRLWSPWACIYPVNSEVWSSYNISLHYRPNLKTYYCS